MNKTQQRQLYNSVSEQLSTILKLVGDQPNRKRLTQRLSHILDIISQSHLSSRKKAKLIEQIDAINRKMQEQSTPVKSSSMKKTKRYSSSAKDKEILLRERVRQSEYLLNKLQMDNSKTIQDEYSPVKGEYQLRSLQIKNQILEEQVQLLKSRVQKARQHEAMENGSTGQTIVSLQSEIRETHRKQQLLLLRINELTKQLIEKDTKIQQLTHNNEKLNKLLRIRDQQIKDSRSKHQLDRRQLQEKVDRMKRYELQAKAFEAVKESIAHNTADQKLRQIIRKYKTLIK